MTELTTAEKISILRDSPAFSSLDEAALNQFAEMARTETFQKSEEVFSYGDFDDRIMVLGSGTVSVSLPGKEKNTFQLKRGDLIGEYGLVVGLRRTASVVASENSTLLSLDYDRFLSFMKEHPGVLIHLFKKAVTRLVELEARTRQ